MQAAIKKRKKDFKIEENRRFIKDLEKHGDAVALLMKKERKMARKCLLVEQATKKTMLGVVSNDNAICKDSRFTKEYKGYWK